MKDINGKEFEICPGEIRNGPAALRYKAQRFRAQADALEILADQIDGTLSEEADAVVFALVQDFKPF